MTTVIIIMRVLCPALALAALAWSAWCAYNGDAVLSAVNGLFAVVNAILAWVEWSVFKP